jgi:hypothetical protein
MRVREVGGVKGDAGLDGWAISQTTESVLSPMQFLMRSQQGFLVLRSDSGRESKDLKTTSDGSS